MPTYDITVDYFATEDFILDATDPNDAEFAALEYMKNIYGSDVDIEEIRIAELI